jgi:hypothetical protein
MDEAWIAYLERACLRAKERRMTWFGPRKTTAAEAAEAVLVGAAPGLVREIKRLRGDAASTSNRRETNE